MWTRDKEGGTIGVSAKRKTLSIWRWFSDWVAPKGSSSQCFFGGFSGRASSSPTRHEKKIPVGLPLMLDRLDRPCQTTMLRTYSKSAQAAAAAAQPRPARRPMTPGEIDQTVHHPCRRPPYCLSTLRLLGLESRIYYSRLRGRGVETVETPLSPSLHSSRIYLVRLPRRSGLPC